MLIPLLRTYDHDSYKYTVATTREQWQNGKLASGPSAEVRTEYSIKWIQKLIHVQSDRPILAHAELL